MIDITLKYYPGRLERFFHLFNRSVFSGNQPLTIVKSVPQNWNELNCDQLLAISRATFLLKDRSVQKIFVAHRFLNLPFRVFKRISVSDINYLYRHVSRLFGENNLRRTVIDCFYVGSKKFIGPADAGSNMSFDEFAKADKFYSQFLKSKNESDLDRLLACMYREKNAELNPKDINFNGDLRVPFNEYHVENRAVQITTLDRDYKYAILLQYSGFRKFLQDRYPLTFSSGEPSKYGLPGMVVELAGEKFGNPDQTFKTNLHAILIYTEQCLQKANKK